jgi:hypothetical protein
MVGQWHRGSCAALLKFPPAVALVDAIRVMKTNSSKWVHQTHRRTKFAWQAGYSAFSVSESGARRCTRTSSGKRNIIEPGRSRMNISSFEEASALAYDLKYVFDSLSSFAAPRLDA